MDNLLTICLNKVKRKRKYLVDFTTLVFASARTRGMMASVSRAWAASSRRMWVKAPGLSSEDTLRDVENVTTTMSASSRSWKRRKCLFKVFSFRIRQNIRILALRMRLALDSGCGSFQFKSLSSTPQLLSHVWSQISSRGERKHSVWLYNKCLSSLDKVI